MNSKKAKALPKLWRNSKGKPKHQKGGKVRETTPAAILRSDNTGYKGGGGYTEILIPQREEIGDD